MGREEKALNASKSPINTSNMTPIEKIAESRMEYAGEVTELSKRAKDYLSSMAWCKEIISGWVGYASGYIIGVFFFEILPSREHIPSYIWVIVGDLPPAYLDIEYCPGVKDAVDGYVVEMQEWVDRVLSGRPLDESVIPVNVPVERRWAEALQTRLDLIREMILNDNGGM
jgi:hypothetical protein